MRKNLQVKYNKFNLWKTKNIRKILFDKDNIIQFRNYKPKNNITWKQKASVKSKAFSLVLNKWSTSFKNLFSFSMKIFDFKNILKSLPKTSNNTSYNKEVKKNISDNSSLLPSLDKYKGNNLKKAPVIDEAADKERRKNFYKHCNDPIFQLYLNKVRNEIDKSRESQKLVSSKQQECNYYSVLHLMPSAPMEVVEASFRQLSKLYHPDAGGNEQMMQKLAQAYNAIKTERLKSLYLQK